MHADLSPRLLAIFLMTILAAASTARSQTDITELAGLKAGSIGPSGMSGRISAIDAVNADPNMIYVGAATGGLWKSTSGGVTWTPLTDSIPASSVDLVIATHGRSVYILDDVGPLRALARDPAIANRSLHLFEVPVAIRYQVAPPDGMQVTGDGMFIGETRPYGALVTYSIPAESAVRDTAKVTFEVLDEAGATIRTFEAPAKPGVNRTAWNLRRDAFRQPRVQEADAASPLLVRGPEVLPGRYTVRVKFEGQEASAAVEVREDPRFQVPMAVQRERLDFIMTVGQRQEVAAEAVDRLRDAKRAVDRAVEQVEANRGATDSTAKALASAGHDLKKALTSVEELFTGHGVQGQVSWSDEVLPQLGNLFGDIHGTLSSAREAPTEAERLYLRAAEVDLKRALERTNRVFAEEVERFRERVAAGLNAELFPAKKPLSVDWRQP